MGRHLQRRSSSICEPPMSDWEEYPLEKHWFAAALKVIFRSFWTFIGTLFLISALFAGIADVILAIQGIKT